TGLQSHLFSTVEHELDPLQTRFVKTPTRAGAAYFRCPVLWAKESHQVVLGITGWLTEVGILQFQEVLIIELTIDLEQFIEIGLQGKFSGTDDLRSSICHSLIVFQFQ